MLASGTRLRSTRQAPEEHGRTSSITRLPQDINVKGQGVEPEAALLSPSCPLLWPPSGQKCCPKALRISACLRLRKITMAGVTGLVRKSNDGKVHVNQRSTCRWPLRRVGSLSWVELGRCTRKPTRSGETSHPSVDIGFDICK